MNKRKAETAARLSVGANKDNGSYAEENAPLAMLTASQNTAVLAASAVLWMGTAQYSSPSKEIICREVKADDVCRSRNKACTEESYPTTIIRLR